MKLVRITREEAALLVSEFSGHRNPGVRRVIGRVADKFKLRGVSHGQAGIGDETSRGPEPGLHNAHVRGELCGAEAHRDGGQVP